MAEADPKIALFAQNAVFRVGTCGPAVVTVWSGPTTVESLDLLGAAQHEHVKRFPKFVTMAVLEGALRQPVSGVRERSVELAKEFEPRVAGSSIVIRAKGLGGAVARTFVAGFLLVSRSPTPTKLSRSVEEGATWLRTLPEMAALPEPAAFAAAVDGFVAEQLALAGKA